MMARPQDAEDYNQKHQHYEYSQNANDDCN
jgi:hypothetical protein